MSPYPPDPVEANGPMRLVLTTYPSPAVAQEQIERIVGARLAACAHLLPVRAWYWWNGKVEQAEECAVLFKTVPKRVGALFLAIERGHPYQVPEIIELDVPRVQPHYLAYLTRELTGGSPAPMGQGELTRPAKRRGRGAPRPARRREPLHHRSRGTGRSH